MGGSLISPIVGGTVAGGGSAAAGNQAWEYDTPGSYQWTVPNEIYWIDLLEWGAGCSGKYNAAGGGGEVVKRRVKVTPGDVIDIVIGAGGIGTTGTSNAYVAGGSTSFGDIVALGSDGVLGGGKSDAVYYQDSNEGSACGGDGAAGAQPSYYADAKNHCDGYGRCPGAYGGGGSYGDGGEVAADPASDASDGTDGGGGGANKGTGKAGNGGNGGMLITA